MEPIRVPAPPAAAFNKNRPVSDLIRAQVNHFKHLEEKLPAERRKGIPQHGITTENDAALYIASMTAVLLGRAVPTSAVTEMPASAQPDRSIPIRWPGEFSLAAGADSSGDSGDGNKNSATEVKQ